MGLGGSKEVSATRERPQNSQTGQLTSQVSKLAIILVSMGSRTDPVMHLQSFVGLPLCPRPPNTQPFSEKNLSGGGCKSGC